MVLPPGLGLLPPPSLWVLGWSCQVWVCGPSCPPRLTICHRWVIVTRLTFSHFSAFASSDGLSFFLLCSTGIEVFSSTYPVAVLICPAQSFAPAGGFNQARPSYSGTGLLYVTIYPLFSYIGYSVFTSVLGLFLSESHPKKSFLACSQVRIAYEFSNWRESFRFSGFPFPFSFFVCLSYTVFGLLVSLGPHFLGPGKTNYL